MTAIDELVLRSKDHPELRKFHAFHRAHPEVLDFLVEEIQLRIDRGLESFSYRSLSEYARWKLDIKKSSSDTFLINDHLIRFYSRAITILHPEFNGRAEFRPSIVDEIFGLEIAPEKLSGDYARRLQCADGAAIENGWRPVHPHVTRGANRKPDIHERTA